MFPFERIRDVDRPPGRSEPSFYGCWLDMAESELVLGLSSKKAGPPVRHVKIGSVIVRNIRRGLHERSPEQPPREQPEWLIERSSEPEKAPQSPRRRWVRWVSFALLPLALIAGAYWFVTGGQVMSTDDAYVEADKVGVSTDVSGIVKEIGVSNTE